MDRAIGSLKANLAWSVPVLPDVLAAHLEAYALLHEREIKGLRLCHRFGQSLGAAITRLPIELVATIEDYLMQDARHALLENTYAEPFKC